MSWPPPDPDTCVARITRVLGTEMVLDNRVPGGHIFLVHSHDLFPVGAQPHQKGGA